ncbi:hypothetical protein NZD89_27975 (plasmid) [Alicyclobacillus fastidiosus]|uniref:Uncharacterized protein n=1 Tax=Alicyclobacillus fastidiosus TaxID=392011 RepID=A0ABY6ZPI4_9BACL|nr:hypothetical protein [Alicyclobacillus fastidiosus]WAH44888.1 hypothetical protein NZD89_27975 [Alicyclobacillus fastidiosus]GMA65647.1 hypothetical protein GCM10025859_60870 [Alicyclobacillus fastidiosus]
MASRKTWIITLPEKLKEEVRVFGIRNGLKIWETVDEAVDSYFETIAEKGETEPKLFEMGRQEDWSIQIDPEKYKKLKLLGVENDIPVYDIINTALYRLVF